MNNLDYHLSFTVGGPTLISGPADYICWINQNFIKSGIPYLFDICKPGVTTSVPVSPSCGASGQACCMTSTPCNGTLTCNGGTCGGGRGPTCTPGNQGCSCINGGCNGTLTCSNNTCIIPPPACGAGGQICCAGNLCNDIGLSCLGGICQTPVVTYSWKTDPSYGVCGPSCGGTGTQTRNVWCERSDGTTVADSSCNGYGTKPATSRSCAKPACQYQEGTCTIPCPGTTAPTNDSALANSSFADASAYCESFNSDIRTFGGNGVVSSPSTQYSCYRYYLSGGSGAYYCGDLSVVSRTCNTVNTCSNC